MHPSPRCYTSVPIEFACGHLLVGLIPQVEISKGYAVSDWRDDIRRCLLGAGLKNKPTTFLFR